MPDCARQQHLRMRRCHELQLTKEFERRCEPLIIELRLVIDDPQQAVGCTIDAAGLAFLPPRHGLFFAADDRRECGLRKSQLLAKEAELVAR